MALFNNQAQLELPERATPGPYPAPADRPERVDYDIVEYARRAGISHAAAARISARYREPMLRRWRREQQARDAAERADMWDRIHHGREHGHNGDRAPPVAVRCRPGPSPPGPLLASRECHLRFHYVRVGYAMLCMKW